MDFYQLWAEAALTSIRFFWKALWAFMLGYVVSSCIQVFVTRERMRRTMGRAGARSVGLATFFGFISSSCSFAALATAKSLFKKGAGFIPAMAFLLASTNLVIELGFVIAVFLPWQFVVGEYLGGVLLILFMWLLVKALRPRALIQAARERVQDAGTDQGEVPDWRALAASLEGWRRVGRTYVMEWSMVWKDVCVGFTVAGVIAAFAPDAFFEALFWRGEAGTAWGALATAQNTLVGPVAAFFTFIGSMGNIPLAAILYQSGVSFAGVMAFIFSDLVVFPVIRIHARYYGLPMALFIAGLFLAALVGASLCLHMGLAALDLLPPPAAPASGAGAAVADGTHGGGFTPDTGFVLNLVFLAVTAGLIWLGFFSKTAAESGHGGHNHHGDGDGGGADPVELALRVAAYAALAWLSGGLMAGLFG